MRLLTRCDGEQSLHHQAEYLAVLAIVVFAGEVPSDFAKPFGVGQAERAVVAQDQVANACDRGYLPDLFGWGVRVALIVGRKVAVPVVVVEPEHGLVDGMSVFSADGSGCRTWWCRLRRSPRHRIGSGRSGTQTRDRRRNVGHRGWR